MNNGLAENHSGRLAVSRRLESSPSRRGRRKASSPTPSLPTVRYSMQCRLIGVSVSSTVAGEVYLNYGSIAGMGNQTVLIAQSSS